MGLENEEQRRRGMRTHQTNLKLQSSTAPFPLPPRFHLLGNPSSKAMSWLPNPFKSLQLPDAEESASDAGAASVKEDLSMIGETIGRQLRGVAAFLAPPPPNSPPASGPVADEDSGDTRSPRIAGIRNDLTEISGSFKSSLSLLSSNKAVIEISKLASNFLQLNEEEGEEEVEDEGDHGVGITDEVVDFVTKISERPECWTDFPLSLNDDDFTMSDAQAEHISVMEQLVPSLADIRTKLSGELSEKQFWMIYFIMLLPRLNENSLNLLSTPEIVEARSTLLTRLQHKRKLVVLDSLKDHIDDSSQSDSKCDEKGREEHASSAKTVVAENKAAPGGIVTEIKGTTENSSEKEDANTGSIDGQRHLQSEDDISFSDLEDDDTDLSTRRYDGSGHGKGQDAGSSSPDGSYDWVRLNESTGSRRRQSREGQPSSQNRDYEGESSDWLSIDEFDHYN